MLDGTPRHGKPRGRRERKKIDTRRRILRAAFELFQQKGFEATTVEEIAERADVGKGTVFNYFPQKTAFLVAAYQGWLELIRDDLGPVTAWQGSARAQFGRVFSRLAELAVNNRALARQVIFENMRQAHLRMSMEEESAGGEVAPSLRAGDGREGGPEAVRLLEDMAREVVSRGKAEGEIRPDVDNAEAGSLIAAAAFHTLVRGLVEGGSAQEIGSSLAEKMDIIFTGLAP